MHRLVDYENTFSVTLCLEEIYKIYAYLGGFLSYSRGGLGEKVYGMGRIKQTHIADKTILIVDDHPANLRLMCTLVELSGYKTETAQSAMAAQVSIRQNPPDMILLDIKMPEVDGYTLCEMLKADPKTAHIPVLFVTALGEQVDFVRISACGALGYLAKPIKLPELAAMLSEQLG